MKTKLYYLLVASAAFIFSACASSPMIQPQINGLVVGKKFDYALKVLEEGAQSYGEQNYLLYLLDYGYVLHLAGDYRRSIDVLEKAKVEYDNLFTKSLTREGSTWLVNDNTAPYRGEDFERVMVNIIQALNFAVLGDWEGALVEARDVDLKLSVINGQYKPDQKNVYKQDAFARFLMGALYEAEQNAEGFNNAYISYFKAFETYQGDYRANYKLETPQILKESLLAVSEFMGGAEFARVKGQLPDTTYVRLAEKGNKTVLYLIQYDGLSPVKREASVPIPLPGGTITRLSFPQYDPRVYDRQGGELRAVNAKGLQWRRATELVEDIGAIAAQNLENRRLRVLAKAVLRSAGKYSIERSVDQKIKSDSASEVFRYISSLYNIVSEKADLRSWQTLPADIRFSRLILGPGDYEIYFNDRKLDEVSLPAGGRKFYVVRTIK